MKFHHCLSLLIGLSWSALAALLPASAAAASAAAHVAPTLAFSPAEIAALQAALDKQWAALQPAPKGNLVFRTLFTMLLNATGTNWHPDRWERLLDLATQMHHRDPASDRHGNFRWFWNDTAVNDPNAVEFAMQRAALAADLATDQRLVREGGEPAPVDSILWVNGHDVGRDLLRGHPLGRE